MVSVPIGGVRVDLQLNSAAFIRDIAKSTSATATGVNRMTGSLKSLRTTVGTINQAFLGFLTVRTLNKVVSFTEQSIKLAAAIKGPLGQAARDFTEQATLLSSSFKIGLAESFMTTLQQGLAASGVGMKELAAAGVIAGNLLGFVFNIIVKGFTEGIPAAVKFSIEALNSLITAINSFAEKYNTINEGLNNSVLGRLLGFGGTTTGNLSTLGTLDVPDITFNLTDLVSATALQTSYSAALQTTAMAQRELNAAEEAFRDLVALNNQLWEQTRTPLEKYAEALQKIKEAHADVDLAARATAQANQQLASTYLDAASQVTGTLAQAFADNKAIQIANALVNAAAAMVRALDLPFPLNWAQVAAVGALAATQIATIRAANPGSSGSIKKTAPGAGVTAAGAASTAAKSPTQRGPSQVVTIKIQGDVFGPEHFRRIVAGINGVQRDGTALLRVA